MTVDSLAFNRSSRTGRLAPVCHLYATSNLELHFMQGNKSLDQPSVTSVGNSGTQKAEESAMVLSSIVNTLGNDRTCLLL